MVGVGLGVGGGAGVDAGVGVVWVVGDVVGAGVGVAVDSDLAALAVGCGFSPLPDARSSSSERVAMKYASTPIAASASTIEVIARGMSSELRAGCAVLIGGVYVGFVGSAGQLGVVPDCALNCSVTFGGLAMDGELATIVGASGSTS